MTDIGMRDPFAGVQDEEEDESLWDDEYGYVWLRPDAEWIWEYGNGIVGDEVVYTDRDRANEDARAKWDNLTDSERKEYADKGSYRVYARVKGEEVWVDMDCCETYWQIRMTDGDEGYVIEYIRDLDVATARIEAEWDALTVDEKDRILVDDGWEFRIAECAYHDDADPKVVRDLLKEKRDQRVSETQETSRIVDTEAMQLIRDYGLSAREAQVVALHRRGVPSSQIARDLGFLEGRTISRQAVSNALNKAKAKISSVGGFTDGM